MSARDDRMKSVLKSARARDGIAHGTAGSSPDPDAAAPDLGVGEAETTYESPADA